MDSFSQKVQNMCKNKLVLLVMFMFITAVISGILVYVKPKEPTETNNEVIIRCVFPSSIISLMVILVLFFAEFPKKDYPLLKEGFFDD